MTIESTTDVAHIGAAVDPRAGELAIHVSNLSINFATYAYRSKRRGPFTREKVRVSAIKNVSFSVRRGETIGLVGRNGAGKSTLLRALAGTCAASEGSIMVSEQPQLLGVKAAMMNRLSGRQNIELGLLSLGFTGDRVVELSAQVEEFTELGHALNRPMKTYSSGMRARLAFGVATVVQPGILLLDEALSVGDIHFKRRSIRRIRAIRENAGVIMIASHNTNEIRRTCDRAIWLEQGEMVAHGDPTEIIEQYRDTLGENEGEDDDEELG